MRKRYLESLESRTADEIAEEEALFTELKRLEQNERRFKKERDEHVSSIVADCESAFDGLRSRVTLFHTERRQQRYPTPMDIDQMENTSTP